MAVAPSAIRFRRARHLVLFWQARPPGRVQLRDRAPRPALHRSLPAPRLLPGMAAPQQIAAAAVLPSAPCSVSWNASSDEACSSGRIGLRTPASRRCMPSTAGTRQQGSSTPQPRTFNSGRRPRRPGSRGCRPIARSCRQRPSAIAVRHRFRFLQRQGASLPTFFWRGGHGAVSRGRKMSLSRNWRHCWRCRWGCSSGWMPNPGGCPSKRRPREAPGTPSNATFSCASARTACRHLSLRRRRAPARASARPVSHDRIASYYPSSGYFAAANVHIFLTAVLSRQLWRYPYARAYRAALAEAGHVCQTFCLTATWLGLAPFCLMGLSDSRLEKDLGLDGITESVLYAAGVGQRPQGSSWAPLVRGSLTARRNRPAGIRRQSGTRVPSSRAKVAPSSPNLDRCANPEPGTRNPEPGTRKVRHVRLLSNHRYIRHTGTVLQNGGNREWIRR